MRASTAFMTSTGESLRRLMAGAISDAGIQQRSSDVAMVVLTFKDEELLGAAKARVERVAERVAEQVGPEDGEADGQAREQDQPGRLLGVLGRGHREHSPPRRIRLGHPEAEEG